jgi:cytochrome b6-f complex iron-sulfur subunit
VTVGDASKYAKDGVYDDFAKSSGFIVVSDKGKIYAVTAVCPHKRGLLVKDPAAAGQIKCTKHDGKFSAAGSPISGPPKTSLARLGIS